jgi:hypothetical protein
LRDRAWRLWRDGVTVETWDGVQRVVIQIPGRAFDRIMTAEVDAPSVIIEAWRTRGTGR